MIRTKKLNNLKKGLRFYAFFTAFAFLTTSCTEDGDFSNPTIEISSPGEGDTFSVNETIELIGRASDDTALQNLNISSNLGLNRDITTFEDETDFPFNIALTPDALTPVGTYFIVFLATDTSGNTDEQEIIIEIQ